MKKIIILFTAALINTAAFAQTTWKSDKAHSHLTFTVTHLMLSDVDGTFKDFSATIVASKPDFSDAKFDFTANATSVNTENDNRDEDLRSANFFDVAKFSTVTFTSTSVKPAAASHYTVTGNLTLHGITKAVTFDLWYRGTITNPMSKAPDAGFQATGVIKRSDFDFGGKYGFGSSILSNEVTFKAVGEFGKAN